MRRHPHVAGPLTASLHRIDFRRPAAIVRKQPESWPHADAERNLGADFEIPVFLEKRSLGCQNARYVFITEQHLLEIGRCPARDNRQHAISNLERIETEWDQASPSIFGIHINLLFAVVFGFSP